MQVVQGQKHHDVSGSRRAESRCHCFSCHSVYFCVFLAAWLLFEAGARAARGKGDRRGFREMPSRPPPTRMTVHSARSSLPAKIEGQLDVNDGEEGCEKGREEGCEVDAAAPDPSHSPGWLRLLGHVWFYSKQGQCRD